MKRVLLTTLVFLFFCAQSLYAQESGTIFWTSKRGVYKANLDSRIVSELYRVTMSKPQDLALDLAGGKMYWVDAGIDKIFRANLDGSELEELITDQLTAPSDIALDVEDGKMYWTAARSAVQWANLDGSNRQHFTVTGIETISIALDLEVRKMYWIEDDMIKRANMSRTDVETLVTGLVFPKDLALDLPDGKMYWVEGGSVDSIKRSNLDGSNVEVFVTNTNALQSIAIDSEVGTIYWISGDGILKRIRRDGTDRMSFSSNRIRPPSGMAIDAASSKLYFIDGGGNSRKIHRANLDATDIEDLIVSEFLDPQEIVVDEEGDKLYWTDFWARKIYRANFDGSGLENVVSFPDVALAEAVAVDPAVRKMYWIKFNQFMRGDLDGSSKESLFVLERGNSPTSIYLDSEAGKVYWVRSDIERLNLDGSGLETLFATDSGSPKSMALDAEEGTLYWVNRHRDVERANVDGTGREVVISSAGSGFSIYPDNIMLDLIEERIYWTEEYRSAIRRINMDGSNLEAVLVDIYKPIDVALCMKASCRSIDPPLVDPPDPFTLAPAYPNPFTSSTTIRYALPETQPVIVEVYDILGRRVAQLENAIQPEGVYEIAWQSDLPAGMYFVQLSTLSGRQDVMPVLKVE